MKRNVLWLGIVLLGCLLGCGSRNAQLTSIPMPVNTPAFTITNSEYPSWITLSVAVERGLIDPRPNYLGTMEQKWGVKIAVREAEYDTCVALYSTSVADAVCITTLDALSPALGRKSVVVMPTSTSDGADMCIVTGVKNLEELKGKVTHGLEKTVSQFVFERNIVLAKRNPTDYPYKNMDPAAAAQAMQQGQKNIDSIMVWNPFALQTLRLRQGSVSLFDSRTLPEEVIDSVVIGKDVLAKQGGKAFACAIIDIQYTLCKWMDDPQKGDDTHVALGRKFSNLGLQDMRLVCKQTKFYNTPDAGIALFTSERFRTQVTPLVVDFCVAKGMAAKKPVVGFECPDADLNFDTSYMKLVKSSGSVRSNQ